MNLRRLTLTLAIVTLLIITLPKTEVATSEDKNARIDLFTHKSPYDGRGPNVASDAFSPDELVVLYAHVTYNENPLQNLLVAFYVEAPNKYSFCLSERTNVSGVAVVNFTIPWPCVNGSEFFGEWYALAGVSVGNEVIYDSLTFKVGWLVELISLRTIDENLTYRYSFGVGGNVGLEIALKGIAKTVKTATIAVTVLDELDVPVSSQVIYDLKVQPNEKITFLYCRLNIPKWTHIGKATAFVSALTKPPSEGGYSYCPPISTTFHVTILDPLTITFHDVAVVNVVPSTYVVEVGQTVNISVLVQNEGTESESFDLRVSINNSPIGEISVSLNAYSWTNLDFELNTTNITPGKYTISASIFPLPNEADLTDNTFVDGEIEVKPVLPVIIHDVAIVDVKVSSNVVFISDSLQINVSITNKGTETETFTIEVYYNLSLIETQTVKDFEPGAYQTLIFVWNTELVPEGIYQISAFANLANDVNILDNWFIDGLVRVIKAPKIQYFLKIKTDPHNITTIPGEGWYDAGTLVNLKAPYMVPVSEGVRYLFLYWDVDGVPQGLGVNAISVVMDANHTATAHYVLQYYLTVESPYGTPGGAGWYNAGSVAYASLNFGLLDHGNGTRRVFTSWGGDASGTNYAQSNPITMNSPKTAIANWKTQYYISLQTNPPGITTPSGSGWYDAGSYAAISTLEYVPGRSRYRFVCWTTVHMAEITDPFSPSTTVLVDKPKTVTANYVRQYQVTFAHTGLGADASGIVVTVNGTALTYSDLPYSIWVEENSIIVYSYEGTVPSTISGKRFMLLSVTGLSSPITVKADTTVTGNYKTQYYLEVSSAYGSPSPTSGWYDAGSNIVASVNSPVPGPTGTRYVCTGWVGTGSVPSSGTSTSVIFTLNAPSSITWNWKTQYLLTVLTDPAGLTPQPTRNPPGEAGPANSWWHDVTTNVTLTAQNISGYNFDYWDVDGASQGSGVNPITVVMDAPKTATAHYVKEAAPLAWFFPEWFYWLLLLLLLLLLIILLLILYYRRRRRKEAGEFHSGWTAWYYRYNLREAKKIS